MSFSNCSIKAVLFSTFTCLSLLCALPQAHAGIVSTTEIVEAQTREINRENLTALLSKEDVRQSLEAQGVDTSHAQQRVASMTDAEIQLLAANMDQLPAGGRLSTIEWLLIIIIILLLI